MTGMIYFRKGIKQDILVMDRYEYKIERKAPSSTYWCCIYKERLKCKARVVSLNKGDTLLLKYLIHNHAPTYFKPYSELIMKIVDIKYWPKRQSLTQGIICKEEKKERVKYEEEVIDTLNPVDEAKKVIEFLMKFDGYIHFREGLKYEIMVLDNYEYKRERQTTPSNMSWCCTYKEKYKCRARLVTNDDKVVIKSMSHNHIATFPNKNKQVELRAVKVHIEYKPSKERNRKKEEAENQSELVKFIISFENEDIEDNEGVKAIKQHEHSEDVVMIPDDDCEEAE